jgi:hypothetical protein
LAWLAGREAVQRNSVLDGAEGQAHRASAGDSGRLGSEFGGGKETVEESPPAGRVTDETDYFLFPDQD